MRDWRAIVRARLSSLSIKPTTEMDLADEIAQHLEDRFTQFCAEGLSDEDAAARAKAEIEGSEFLSDISGVFPNE